MPLENDAEISAHLAALVRDKIAAEFDGNLNRFSESAGVTRQTLDSWLNGKTTGFSIALFAKVLHAFDVDLPAILEQILAKGPSKPLADFLADGRSSLAVQNDERAALLAIDRMGAFRDKDEKFITRFWENLRMNAGRPVPPISELYKRASARANVVPIPSKSNDPSASPKKAR